MSIYSRPGEGIGICTKPQGVSGLVEEHMAHAPPTAWDSGATEKLAPDGIKAYESVRGRPRLNQPEAVAIVDRHAIGMGLSPAWHPPLGDLTVAAGILRKVSRLRVGGH